MQRGHRNVTQEVERAAIRGEAGAVNDAFVKNIVAMYI